MPRSPSPTLSDSELLDSIADSFDYAAHREARMEALAQQVKAVKNLRETGDGEYGRVVEYKEEKGMIERMAKEKYCLINFFHPDFKRCEIMDRKLTELAPSHPHTLFLKASVDNVPFLVSKMAIKVLPCVMCYVDGRAVDRLIGFEELGQTDNFSTKALEFRLQQSGVFPRNTSLSANLNPLLVGKGRQANGKGSDSEDSEDEDERRRTQQGRGRGGIRTGMASKGDSDDDDW
ncbi:hypothetical protein, variant [Cryptococcus amylolentus CBS 6039]|uniref:Uncharacterized protein n=1 Tax=Cryptococcus amylolentus CBS 6039 TaxID=1295533 RepID=A0A1E3HYY3_9TREE|nr:hypothetical protein L202_01902 [Cryptococcus amylolentus CBS 6039]XP_018995796.1 hypothetical protein, variant [Cryptococcus amylolentus CBS 6039]ODN81476.1 hypothetical protein L202_01902 [Cryptococcus amylolentus CBS 6039]ODN81477.1 hypothetical protein, variant [Cryptococcus amylolentus CBS 6039]